MSIVWVAGLSRSRRITWPHWRRCSTRSMWTSSCLAGWQRWRSNSLSRARVFYSIRGLCLLYPSSPAAAAITVYSSRLPCHYRYIEENKERLDHAAKMSHQQEQLADRIRHYEAKIQVLLMCPWPLSLDVTTRNNWHASLGDGDSTERAARIAGDGTRSHWSELRAQAHDCTQG